MKNKNTLLVIEEEPAVLRFLRPPLEHAGWDVVEARSGRQGLDLAASRNPEVVLLDLELPDEEGLNVLKALRQWSLSPILIMAAGDGHAKIAGLQAGADGYLQKPFVIHELLAHLHVALRHAEQSLANGLPVYEHRGLRVDLVARRAWLHEDEIHLSPMQYDLLATLIRHAGRVVSQDQLIKEVWGEKRPVTPELVRTFVHQLRSKIEPDPMHPCSLKTENRVGYRLEAPLH